MSYLSKSQVKDILDQAPANLDKGKIVQSLVEQGNELEGFNDSQKQPSQDGFFSRAAKSVVKTVTNPILKLGATANALGTSKVLGGQGTNNAEYKTAVGNVKPITTAKEAAGVGAELGGLALGGEAGTLAKFGSKFIAGAAAGALSGAGQKLQDAGSKAKDVLKSAGTGAVIGGAIPVAGEAFSLAKRFVGAVAKGSAASLSGAGSDAIQAIVDNPKAAKAGLRGEPTKVLKDLSSNLRTHVSGMAKEAQSAYQNGVEKLPASVNLSTEGTKQKLAESFDRFGVKITKSGLNFEESPFVDAESKILERVKGVVDNWTDTSPKGINKLAMKIGQFRKSGVTSPELNSVIDATKKSVRDYLGEAVPEAKVLNGNYAKTQDFLQAIDSELATNGKFIGGTTELNNTAKKIATIFNKNKELARELVERLPSGNTIMAKEAGRELSAVFSRSTSSIGDLTRGAIQSVIRLVRLEKWLAATGIAHQSLEPV